MRVCWIGIGGNLGNSHEVFDAAWNELAQQPDLQLGLRSGIYHTSPVGQHAGNTFSNAVFCVCTSLEPTRLLTSLQKVEVSLGRKNGVRWGSRPIDLDILFVDQLVMDEPSLKIPHRAAWYRRFVIDPLFEVAPTLHHPLINQTITELKVRLSTRPLIIACRNSPQPQSVDLASRFPDARFVAGDEPASIGFQLEGIPPALFADGIPIADLTNTPGDAHQRITDFLTSLLDEPQRVGDW
jgi:2-amino-4-hydroxy-6-hydroxymethyldihydropteridine diphosphokinase